MPLPRARSALLAAAVVAGLAAPLGPVGPGSAAAVRDDPAPLVLTDGRGQVRLVGARPGRSLAAAPAGVADPAVAAHRHLGRYARTFGLARSSLLRTVAVTHAASGHDVVRVQQSVAGIPVVGGQLVTVLDPSGALVSVGGEVAREVTARAFTMAASAAARTAVAAVARHHGLGRHALRAGRPTRAFYDAALIDPAGRPGARAVWRVEVRAPGRVELRDLVLIDAASGEVALRVGQVAAALDRVVCDNAGLSTTDEVCRPGDYTRVEGQPPTGIPDVDQAYDLTGVTADWFATRLGVDLTALIGNDLGDGPKLRSTTRYCGPEGCPLDNAFWTGDQMVYGAGFTSADDVVAHELLHGVTQQTAGLIYWFQSGAINESMSDVFGELVDLADGVGTDTAEARWQLGEDLPASAGGVARDMSDPTAYDQPDHTGSDRYDFAPDYDDNGAVHTNSGVGNKTAYLIADGTVAEPGGAFNGHAFPGIGTEKTALVYWSALQMLTPGADFMDLSAALQQGCANLAAVGTGGVVAPDCSSVASAAAATGLSRWRGPTVPREVQMTPGARSVALRWSRPASSGSSPVSSYAVWVRPAPADEDFVALEPAARSFVVEGLRPGVDYTIGLVAVSADGSSPSVTRTFAGSALRMDWPEPAVVGDALLVRGVLRGATAPLAGRTVRLLRRYPGEARYDRVTSAVTGTAGRFVLRSVPARGATYVVVYPGRVGVLGDQTAPHVVPLRQRVTVATDPSLRRVELARFRGGVTPARPGAAVQLQRLRGDGTWRTVAAGRLDGRGRYDLTAPRGARRDGVWRVRVPRAAGSGLIAGLSREVEVTVG